MLKDWQFNVLFFVGVGGALFLLVAPSLGVKVSQSPMTVSGVGAILTYILTQKKVLTKHDDKKRSPTHKKEGGENGLE